MAITAEQIQTVIAGEGNEVTDSIKAISESIVKMHEEDVAGLKRTNAALKDEKTEVSTKLHAEIDSLNAKNQELTTQFEKAQEQIKNSDPDGAKKYFEQQREILEEGYKSKLAEKETQIGNLNSQIAEFKNREIYSGMRDEFRRAAAKANVASDSLEIVESFILGPNGSNFTPRETSEGRVFWTPDGDDIESRLDKFLKTPSGKRFLPFNSSGSSAEGGSVNGGSNGTKSMTFAEFNKLSPSERAAKIREGYKINS